MQSDLILAASTAGSSLPPYATTVDQAFAWGSVALLIALISWHALASRGEEPTR